MARSRYQVLFLNGSVAERFRHHPFKMGYARSIRVASTRLSFSFPSYRSKDDHQTVNLNSPERGGAIPPGGTILKHGVLISLISLISFKNTPCKTSEARLDAQIKFVAPDDKLRFFQDALRRIEVRILSLFPMMVKRLARLCP